MRGSRLATALLAIAVGGTTGGLAFAQTVSDPAQNPPAVPLPQALQQRATPPRLVTEVKPTYTPEAMRAQIQGGVSLSGVVERDGTVSDIQVVQSLDAVNGLDAAAVAAFRQWRFQPALLDGAPIRVIVTVEMKFTLREGPPVARWPSAFPTPAQSTSTAWAERRLEMDNVEIRIGVPPGWTESTASGGRWLTLASRDGLRQVTISEPVASDATLDRMVDSVRLLQIANTVKQAKGATAPVQAEEVGQVIAPQGHLWVWIDQTAPDGSRTWMFTGVIGRRSVTVTCTATVMATWDAGERERELRGAADDCAGVINRVAITPKPIATP